MRSIPPKKCAEMRISRNYSKYQNWFFFPKNALAMPFFRLITFWTAQKVRKLEKFAILWDMRDHSSRKIELICLKMPFLRQNTLYNFHQKRKMRLSRYYQKSFFLRIDLISLEIPFFSPKHALYRLNGETKCQFCFSRCSL